MISSIFCVCTNLFLYPEVYESLNIISGNSGVVTLKPWVTMARVTEIRLLSRFLNETLYP